MIEAASDGPSSRRWIVEFCARENTAVQSCSAYDQDLTVSQQGRGVGPPTSIHAAGVVCAGAEKRADQEAHSLSQDLPSNRQEHPPRSSN
jgi:hypothetical protein